MGAAVTGHRDRRGGSQHPNLAAVVHPRQADHRGWAEGPDLLLAQLDVDGAALRCGAVLERQPVLAQPWRIGGQRRAGRRQCQPYVRPVLTGALPDHGVGLQCQGVPVEHGPVGGPPQRTRGEVAQAQPDRPGDRGLHGQLDMADQLGGLLLGDIHGLLSFPEFDSESGQSGFHGAELLAVRVALVVHPVQFAGPAEPFGLPGSRRLRRSPAAGRRRGGRAGQGGHAAGHVASPGPAAPPRECVRGGAGRSRRRWAAVARAASSCGRSVGRAGSRGDRRSARHGGSGRRPAHRPARDVAAGPRPPGRARRRAR